MRRYAVVMLILAAAAIATAASSTPRRSAQDPVAVETTATVRIISGVRVRLDSTTSPDAPPAHQSIVTADGVQRTAQLTEFQ